MVSSNALCRRWEECEVFRLNVGWSGVICGGVGLDGEVWCWSWFQEWDFSMFVLQSYD